MGTAERRNGVSVYRYAPEELIAFSDALLVELGVPPSDAAEVSHCLVGANLKGFDSHGIVRLPVYAGRLKAGAVKARPKLQVMQSSGSIMIVDGDNGLGPVTGAYAMGQVVARAKEWGIGFATVKRSNHFGAAGYYVEKAVKEGCIGFAASNAPPNMAPWGGSQRFLGTNPFAIGIPIKGGEPLLIDMATSVVARGKIILAEQQGESIPKYWAVDPNGYPTTDPAQALLGAVLPFGGPKGAALSLAIDILCGVLSGAAYGRHLNTLEDLTSRQNLGHCFMAIDARRFMDENLFSQRVTDLIQQLKSTPLAPGFDEILAPGELEQRSEQRLKSEGITLTHDVIGDLKALGDSVGVNLPTGGLVS